MVASDVKGREAAPSSAPAETLREGVQKRDTVKVGYVLTEKKCKSLFSSDLVQRARDEGVCFFTIDPTRPIEEQEGHPFDVVLQKVPGSSPYKEEWDERIQKYAEGNPSSYVVDLPDRVRQISNRSTMLDVVNKLNLESVEGRVRAPRQITIDGDANVICTAVEASGLKPPLLAKALLADGGMDAHKVAIIHDMNGLSCLARGEVSGLQPPCVVQEYVDHGGCLFKVYVVGDTVTSTVRRSLPNLHTRQGLEGGHVCSGVEGEVKPGGLVYGKNMEVGKAGAVSIQRVSAFACGQKELARSSEPSNGAEVGKSLTVGRVASYDSFGELYTESPEDLVLSRGRVGVKDRGRVSESGQLGSEDDTDSALEDHVEVVNQPAQPGAKVEKGVGWDGEDGTVYPPSTALLETLALSLRDKLNLRLFNFDLIRVNGSSDEYLVVDINYFPGIAKMPGFTSAFCSFLRSAGGSAAGEGVHRDGWSSGNAVAV